MNEHLDVYESMRRAGTDAKSAYLHAKKEGMDEFARIRMLRTVYRLSLTGAKEISVTADGASDRLSEHQQKLLPGLETVFDVSSGKESAEKNA